MPAEQLSGTIVVIIIAVGVQGCIMLFIFAKRQIMRFALRNRRGPHTSIGQGAPKPLRREADRCLEYIPYIRFEPRVANWMMNRKGQIPEHYFRANAIELYSNLELKISSYGSSYSRLPGSNVRSFLLKCSNGPLYGIDARDIHILCDDYEKARHHYEEFGDDKLRSFTAQIQRFTQKIDENKIRRTHQPSPNPGQLINNKGGFGKRKGNKNNVSFALTTSPDSRSRTATNCQLIMMQGEEKSPQTAL